MGMHNLGLGVFRLMSSHHEWIAGIITLSCHGKMMEKEKEEGSMPKDSCS